MLDVIIGRHTRILLFSPYGERVAKYAHTYNQDTHTHKKIGGKRQKGVGEQEQKD